MTTETTIDAICAEMRQMGSLVVAFSGGVDSAVVAALAFRALGDKAYAVTAVSETLADRELEEAVEIAREIGIEHKTMSFSELASDDFVQNSSSRCFFCQSMRFDQLGTMAQTLGVETVASGTNADDIGDHRPGLKAMEQRAVYQPLLKHGVDKAGVRALAQALGLSVWDKPAAACLSSRIPHGISVTHERLRRIELAEDVLHSYGFRQFRVRDHAGLARIEVAPNEMEKLLNQDVLTAVRREFEAAGFRRVTVDMSGYKTGSLNPVRSNVRGAAE